MPAFYLQHVHHINCMHVAAFQACANIESQKDKLYAFVNHRHQIRMLNSL